MPNPEQNQPDPANLELELRNGIKEAFLENFNQTYTDGNGNLIVKLEDIPEEYRII